jgi:hypothetical protein
MKTQRLNKEWKLTTDDKSSSTGEPVLVNTISGKIYSPTDWVQLTPKSEPRPASIAVLLWKIRHHRCLPPDWESNLQRYLVDPFGI